MRAKHNLKIKLLICCLAVIVLLAATLVACNDYEPDHYDYLVTFDYNVGKLSEEIPNLYLGVVDKGNGGLVSIRPGFNDSTFSEATITGYYVENWYEAAQIGADGEPVRDENDGRVLLKSEPFDFHTRITGPLTLYANLKPSPKLRFIDIETGKAVSEIDGIKPGEVCYRPSSGLAPKKVVDGQPYTFMNHYWVDKERSAEFEFAPYVFEDHDVDVYCDFIKGEWTLVGNANELTNALRSRQNIYLLDDIDFSGQTFSSVEFYNAEFNGNGHTVKGISFGRTGSFGPGANSITDRRKNNVGIFQSLRSKAYIHDVIFEDVTVEIETSSNYDSIYDLYVGLFAGVAEDGARIENVTVSGTLTCDEYTKSAKDHGNITIKPFIGNILTSEDRIVGCDYSRVEVIYLS